MSETLWNDEWPQVNTGRAYPLRPGCTRTAGQFVIPDSLIIDAAITLPRIGGLSDPTLVHIYQIGVLAGGLVITIGYNNTPIAVAPVNASAAIGDSVVLMPLYGYEAVGGVLTIGTLAEALSYPGVWPFSVDTARFEPTLVRVAPNSVQALTVIDSSGATSVLRGDVQLRAGINARILAAGRVATIDALGSAGSGYADECNCNTVRLGTPISTINGVGPNANGDFYIGGVGCADVQVQGNGLLIDDLCSTPCCGCQELDVIVDKLQILNTDMDNMKVAASNLSGVVSQLGSNLATIKTQD